MPLNDCGCCGADDTQVTDALWNDPGLSSIQYRIGEFGTFKRAMHEALETKPELGRLTTRDDSDPAMATIDAWSTVLDVLTFYQERIANENYLRTASEPLSMTQLGREVGYLLAPGTAATTYLAFKVDDSGYGPASVRVDAGTKVQSQPGQDELPQVYETLESIVAKPQWNVLPVRRVGKDQLTPTRHSAYFTGNAFDIKLGDTLLFVAPETQAAPSKDNKALAKVTAITRDDSRKVTSIEWLPALPSGIDSGTGSVQVFVLRQRAAIFGYNAIDYAALPLTLTIGDKSPKDGTFVAGPYASDSGSWADAALSGDTIDLESLYPSITVGSWVAIEAGSTVKLFKVKSTREVLASRFMLSAKVTELQFDRSDLGAFSPKNATVLAQSDPLTLDLTPIDTPLTGGTLESALVVDRPEKGRTLLVVGKRPTVQFPSGSSLSDESGNHLANLSGNERLPLMAAPTALSGTTSKYAVQRDDGTTAYATVADASVVYGASLASDSDDQGEVVTVKEATDDPGDITITSNLKFAYDRTTARIYGNVAYASHGETKKDTLGSGNAAKPFQAFDLPNKPLTYLASATDTGYESTLQVRVDDVQWQETLTLYGEGPKDRVFTARQDETQKTTIRFGNGITGARPSTGVENVAAQYRVGAGLQGRVRAAQLNMLLTRPLGITDVTNPLAASGGSDPESPNDARRNIPRSALTLGRIVSVQDFADHAARYPGIAKAQSTLLWSGTHQVVFLTVSGVDAETVDTTNLEGSIDSVRDTHFPVVVKSVELLSFAVSIEVLIRLDYQAEKVLPAVQNQLGVSFGFDLREFAEAVTVSELLSAVQKVDGVEAANVLALDFATVSTPTLNDVLRAKPARYDGGALLPSQILLIDPAKVAVKEMKRDS